MSLPRFAAVLQQYQENRLHMTDDNNLLLNKTNSAIGGYAYTTSCLVKGEPSY